MLDDFKSIYLYLPVIWTRNNTNAIYCEATCSVGTKLAVLQQNLKMKLFIVTTIIIIYYFIF